MNKEIETTRHGRRGKEPGQPASVVVRLPAWLNDKLCEHQSWLKKELGISMSKEDLILLVVNQWLIGNEPPLLHINPPCKAEKGAGE